MSNKDIERPTSSNVKKLFAVPLCVETLLRGVTTKEEAAVFNPLQEDFGALTGLPTESVEAMHNNVHIPDERLKRWFVNLTQPVSKPLLAYDKEDYVGAIRFHWQNVVAIHLRMCCLAHSNVVDSRSEAIERGLQTARGALKVYSSEYLKEKKVLAG